MTSEYNIWPEKACPSRRHFGRAVDRSIEVVTSFTCTRKTYNRNYSVIPGRAQKFDLVCNSTNTVANIGDPPVESNAARM